MVAPRKVGSGKMDGETFRSYNDKTNIYSVICDIIHNIIDYNYFVNIYIYTLTYVGIIV